MEEKFNSTDLNPSTWVETHGDYLYNYAWSRVQSKELAEDLVQDTFVSALNSLRSFRGESKIRTWLLAILKRKVVDHYRKKSTQSEKQISGFVSPFEGADGFDGHWILERAPKDWNLNNHNPLRDEEFKKMIEGCISLLPEKWRSVFVLKVMEEMESSEICKEMNCTPSNFWVILHRVRLQMRECIEKKWLND